MIILPAIDIQNGECVRLYRGDFATAHKVAEDPLVTAGSFYRDGARWIHMVDLDGARTGRRENAALFLKVADQSGLQVELGGGIRCMEDLEAVFQAGVGRAVIGSAAVSDPDFVRAAAERYGERVAVGIDTQDGRVRTAGWVEDSGLDYLEFAKFMMEVGVKNIIFTDIETDGALSGPSFARLEALKQVYTENIVASGGVSSNEDIRRLARMGLYGAIVGKAYYAGTVDLAQAVRDAGRQD